MNKNLSQSNDALHSIQNANQNQIIMYRPDDTISLNVRLENETVWLSIDMMSELFQRDKSTISRHIKNIFSEGELMPISVVAKFATTKALPTSNMLVGCLFNPRCGLFFGGVVLTQALHSGFALM